MNREDKHRGFHYCMYMMLTSYFDKSICITKVNETRFLLQYREMGSAKQIENELRCIRLIEGQILRDFPEKLLKTTVWVRMWDSPKTGSSVLQLYNESFCLRVDISDEKNRFNVESALEIYEPVKNRSGC